MAGVGSDQGSGAFNDSANIFAAARTDSSAAFQGEVNSMRSASGNTSMFGTGVSEAQKGWADFSCAIFDGNNPPQITGMESTNPTGPNSQNQNRSDSAENTDRNTALAAGLASIRVGDALSETVKDTVAEQMASNGSVDVKALMAQVRRQQKQQT